MTTLRTAIEDLLQAIDAAYIGSGALMVLEKANTLRAALGTEPTDDGMKTERDGFRVEAADQFGFTDFNDDCTEHRCTTATLVAFAKACEHAGLAQARDMIAASVLAEGPFPLQYRIGWSSGQHSAEMKISAAMHALAAELDPIREAVTEQRMTAAGYVRAPEVSDKLWVKPSCGRRGGNCQCQTASECIEC